MARLVDLVEVGALLAIDLDVDVKLVHELRRRFVLERLVGHDVAPVARGIADRKQDGLARLPSFLERFVVPGLPVNGVVRVLLEIRARLFAQSIFHAATMHLPRQRIEGTSAVARHAFRPACGWWRSLGRGYTSRRFTRTGGDGCLRIRSSIPLR